MGNCGSTIEIKEELPRYESDYDRLNKIESIFLRDISNTDKDYLTARKILNERTNKQYGDMMRNSWNKFE